MKADDPAPLVVAVIEDELPIRRFLRMVLEGEGFVVIEAETLKEAGRLVTTQVPGIVILDLGLPDGDGKTLVTAMREWTDTPVIILSARDQEREKVAALDAGADDYLVKPFGSSELLARVRVALRHRARRATGKDGRASTTFRHGELAVDVEGRRVWRAGREVHLTRIEFDLLATLIRHAGRVLTHHFLLREVWGPGNAEQRQYLRVFVANLRKKIEQDPARPTVILTEQGVGYRLADPEGEGRADASTRHHT